MGEVQANMISFSEYLNERELVKAARIAIRRQVRDWKTLKDNPHLTWKQKAEYLLHHGNEHGHDLANYHHDVTTPTQGALQAAAGVAGGVIKGTAEVHRKLKERAARMNRPKKDDVV